MSTFVRRGTAVRLSVLLLVTALAVTWSVVTASRSPSTSPPTATDVRPVEQVSLGGTTLAPSAIPPSPRPRKHHRARDLSRSKVDRAHHRRHARHRIAVRKARQRARAAHWRHTGGRDISWPQCPVHGRHRRGEPMPPAGATFVVVGLTAGRAFAANPCLSEHLRWVRSHHVRAAAYAFAAFPSRAELRRHGHRGPYDGRHRRGALRNAGYATARFNIGLMRRHGFVTPHVWLDVEPSSSHPWSHRRELNRAVVRGWIAAYRSAGYTVGFYSTPLLWGHILGRYRPGLPEWRTSGPASPRAALRKCREVSFQGGPAVIAQWWTGHRDFDRLCPVASRRDTLRRYFHQW